MKDALICSHVQYLQCGHNCGEHVELRGVLGETVVDVEECGEQLGAVAITPDEGTETDKSTFANPRRFGALKKHLNRASRQKFPTRMMGRNVRKYLSWRAACRSRR